MFLLIPLAAAALGLGLFLAGFFGRSRVVGGLGIVVISLIIAAEVATVVFKPNIEWNPSIRSDAEVLGIWTDRSETLCLESDQTFTYRSPTQTASGTWTRGDWNLYLKCSPQLPTMRFVQLGGSYRLMTRPPEDPDEWDWRNPGLRPGGR